MSQVKHARIPPVHVSSSYVIEDVELWTSEGAQSKKSVWIKNGILQTGTPPTSSSSLQKIDGRGLVLLPAGVDAQVHLRVPGQRQKELPQTGLLSALRGGYSAVLTMPNTNPTIDSVEVLQSAKEEVREFEEQYGVRVFWSAAITQRLNTDHLTPFQELVDAGVLAFTNDGLGVDSDNVMDQAFAALEKLGVPLLQHAEFLGHGGSLAPGPVQRQVKAPPYPDDPEWKMVERDLRELRKHPSARYHVLHISSRKTLQLIRAAKATGLKVTGEVSPHHLYFNTETIDGTNTSFKMNPPIRSPEDQAALWRGLVNGEIDFVATDHAPHEPTMKTGEFAQIAFGTIGMETTLPVLLEAWQKDVLSPARLVQVYSTRPAEFLNLPREYGRWTPGERFHGVLVDAKASPHRFQADDFSSLSKNSCFIGSALPGQIRNVFHGANIFDL